MPFFDFHLHPALKAQFSSIAQKPSPWENIRLRFRDPDLLLQILKCQGINEVVDSQASLDQLISSGVNLVAIALHPPEGAMMRDGLIQKIAEEEQTRYIDNDKTDWIATGNHYYELLIQELEHLQQHQEAGGKKLKLIRSINEYDPAAADTVHAVLTVEGAHAFYGKKNSSGHYAEAEARAHFMDFTENRGIRIFSMNITHLEKNIFCNHAFGIQIFKPRPFFPESRGISPAGLQLLLDMKEKGILCDIKHMSLFARQQLYATGWQQQGWPLVCTHAGLTGIPSSGRRSYFLHHRRTADGFLRVRHFKPKGYLAGTSFNASSINLYDDDVLAIIRSGGLIGLSLDQRILGVPEDLMLAPDYMADIYEQEVISPGECDFFRDISKKELPENAVLAIEDIRTEDRQHYPLYHARHFWNQLFHLFRIAHTHQIPFTAMAKRICIGSDFDGMINPVDGCPKVTGLESFKNRLLAVFASCEEEFFRLAGYRISAAIPADQLLQHIFYQNGLDFLKLWYR